ncbi:hypothetical protein ACF0H5_021639 [Mactra antiquata]
MGIFGSKPNILLTEKPWRSQNCDGEELVNTLERDIKKLNPKKKPGIILLGPVAAGKSSFINSCLSVGIGRIKKLAMTGVRASSFTIQLLTYTDSLLLKNFRVMDCMGIEQDIMAGFNINDTRNLLEGHIKIGYKFENSNPIDHKSDYYRPNPDVEDKIHCVVLVLTAKTIIDGVQREFVKKINHFLDETRAVGIQRILILTKCDLLCSEVDKDAGNMFRSEIIKKAVDKANQLFAIEINAIHPFENSNPIDQKSDYYRSNPDVEDKIHCVVLVLTAKTIIDGVQREFVKKINHFLDETRAVGIQRILILTKCDLLCSEVAKDAGNMFRSEIIKKAVDKANQLFAIGINAIHPVINYEVDVHLSTAKNIPIMLALCQILQCASDRVEYQLDKH